MIDQPLSLFIFYPLFIGRPLPHRFSAVFVDVNILHFNYLILEPKESLFNGLALLGVFQCQTLLPLYG
jgi:hypothetical protein